MKKVASEKINLAEYWRLRITHKILHHNKLFYTLTPELSLATIWAAQQADPVLFASEAAYYEFGVFKGYNLWLASKLLPGKMVYGFDSFKGMPKEKGAHPHHAPGGYSASIGEVLGHLKKHDADPDCIRLYKGWFTEKFFRDQTRGSSFPPVLIATIDCDLYTSCVPVLDFLRPLLRQGTILLFDDWNMPAPSEREAMDEFLVRNPSVWVETMFDFGMYGKALQVKGV